MSELTPTRRLETLDLDILDTFARAENPTPTKDVEAKWPLKDVLFRMEQLDSAGLIQTCDRDGKADPLGAWAKITFDGERALKAERKSLAALKPQPATAR